jgi:endonuclease YncB( thermonuclease family)
MGRDEPIASTDDRRARALQSLRTRKRWKLGIACALGLLALGVVIGWVTHRNLRSELDGQSLRLLKSLDDGRLQLARDNESPIDVRLLGIDQSEGWPNAQKWLDQLADERLLLRVDELHLRDKDNCPVCYAYLADGRMINVLLLQQGLAKWNEQTSDELAGLFRDAQSQARRKHVGLWAREHRTAPAE